MGADASLAVTGTRTAGSALPVCDLRARELLFVGLELNRAECAPADCPPGQFLQRDPQRWPCGWRCVGCGAVLRAARVDARIGVGVGGKDNVIPGEQ